MTVSTSFYRDRRQHFRHQHIYIFQSHKRASDNVSGQYTPALLCSLSPPPPANIDSVAQSRGGGFHQSGTEGVSFVVARPPRPHHSIRYRQAQGINQRTTHGAAFRSIDVKLSSPTPRPLLSPPRLLVCRFAGADRKHGSPPRGEKQPRFVRPRPTDHRGKR